MSHMSELWGSEIKTCTEKIPYMSQTPLIAFKVAQITAVCNAAYFSAAVAAFLHKIVHLKM